MSVFTKLLSGDFKESDFEKAVRECATRQLGWSYKFQGSMLQRKGFPDVVIILPNLKVKPHCEDRPLNFLFGESIFIECKVEGGRAGASQKKLGGEINSHGGCSFISMCKKDGFVVTYRTGAKLEGVHNTHVGTFQFKSGLWLRDVLKTIGKKRSPIEVPASFLEKPSSGD